MFDRGFTKIATAKRSRALAGAAVLAIAVVLPVAVISILLQDRFLQIPYFVFAVLILLLSLGPRDLVKEVNDYCAALENDEIDQAARTAKELLEREPPIEEANRSDSVERAIYIQANNRIFGVCFMVCSIRPNGRLVVSGARFDA